MEIFFNSGWLWFIPSHGKPQRILDATKLDTELDATKFLANDRKVVVKRANKESWDEKQYVKEAETHVSNQNVCKNVEFKDTY